MRRSCSARARADDRGVERAFELLRILILAEIALGERELAFGNEAGLAYLEHEGKPILFRLRAPPQLEESVAALGVPMKTAQPCRSTKAGRMISDHTRGSMSAYSTSTTPSR